MTLNVLESRDDVFTVTPEGLCRAWQSVEEGRRAEAVAVTKTRLNV